MASPSSTTLSVRRLTAAILGALALLIISVFVFQPASAQRQPATAKPPFKLHAIQKTQPLTGVPPLPLNAPIIVSQTFSSNFVYTTTYSDNAFNFDVTDNRAPWHLVNYSGVVDNSYTWGRLAGAPLTDTVWNAGTNPPQKDNLVPGSPYTVNMNSMLVYGPVNLSDYTTIILSATYFLDVQSEDSYGVAYSLNGTDFIAVSNEFGRDPSLSTRRNAYYNLPATARQDTVWLAFYFTSGNHPIDALGVFLDEVVVRGVKLNKLYLPFIQMVLPTSTPTATPTTTPTATPTVTPTQNALYNYTFGTGLNTNPEFVAWGGANTYSCGTGCDITQDVSTNGNPSGAVNYEVGGKNIIAGTSPNHTIPTDYDLSADFMMIEGKQDGRFGLVFGASTSTFYNDGGIMKMNPAYNYYKVDLNVDPNDETLINGVRLQRWSGGLSTNLVSKLTLPAQYQRSKGQWGNLRVVVKGSYITVYVNGYAAIVNYFDDTYTTSARKFGVFMHPQLSNNNANPFKIRFDNVVVKPAP